MGNGRNQVEVVEGVELNNQITESSSYQLYIIITLLTDIYKYLSIVEQFNIYIFFIYFYLLEELCVEAERCQRHAPYYSQ